MRLTLDEFLMLHPDVDLICLKFGEHVFTVNTKKAGSFAILRAFYNYKFSLERYEDKYANSIMMLEY